jgi:hypothetical protein
MKKKLKKAVTECHTLKCLIAIGEAEYFRKHNVELSGQVERLTDTTNKFRQLINVMEQLIELVRKD